MTTEHIILKYFISCPGRRGHYALIQFGVCEMIKLNEKMIKLQWKSKDIEKIKTKFSTDPFWVEISSYW